MILFGFEISRKKDEGELKDKVFSIPQNEDGALVIHSGSYYGTYVDIDGTVRNEVELITRYRDMSLQPEMETAITEITNEAIVYDDKAHSVSINTDELKQPATIKNKIAEEFDYILKLLNFGNNGQDIFQRWYIDGRIFYHIVIDEKDVETGIKELRYIDPRRIRKIREIQKSRDPRTGIELIKRQNEYYLYNERGIIGAHSNLGARIAIDSVVNINSGLMDSKQTMVMSYLHKAIKPLNQLRMIEDATVIYRLSRAPERRIFYVDVGNMSTVKAEQYLRDVMTKYRNKLVYDSGTGEVKDDRRHLCLSMDTKVPLLDGRILTLNEISQEYKRKNLWVYSCDPITGKFSPGLITWAGVSKKNALVMKITLDNGETIVCTPEHRFPTWNNGLTMAKDLQIGESMIPLYRRHHGITPGAKKNKDYEQIWLNDKQKWKFTHTEVSNWKDDVGLENKFIFNENYNNSKLNTVHHVNINRFDNSPENLTRMNNKDHILYHQHSSSGSGKIGGKRCYELKTGFHNKEHPNYIEWHIRAGKIGGTVSAETGKSQENFAKGRNVFNEFMKDSDYREWFKQQQIGGWTQEKRDIAANYAKTRMLSAKGNAAQKELWKTKERKEKHYKMYAVDYDESIFKLVESCVIKGLTRKQCITVLNGSKELIDSWQVQNQEKSSRKVFDRFTRGDLDRIVKKYSGTTFQELKEQIQHVNHKVAKIEYLEDRIDTGCLTIDGNEIYHDNHTFALAAGIYTQNSMLEDIWLARREGQRGTEVTTLQGAQNLGELEDVKYFEKKLYKSLGVPISRLESSQGFSLGRTTEITRDELKFTKFIQRLRNKFSGLFDELLRIQLVLKNVCTEEEWKEFREDIWYDFKKDNNFTELKESELMTTRITLLQMMDPFVGRYFSQQYIKQNVLHQDEDEIEEIAEQMQQEQAQMQPQVDAQGNPIQQPGMPQQGMQQGMMPGQDPNQPMPVPPTPLEQLQAQQMNIPIPEPKYRDEKSEKDENPLEDKSKKRFVNDTLEVAT